MSIYTEFDKDIERYLTSKLPDLPVHTAMEIGEYIGNRTRTLVYDHMEIERKERTRQVRYRDAFDSKRASDA